MIYIANKNDFKKKQSALRLYFMKSYKYFIFDIMNNLRKKGKKDGLYEIDLNTDKDFYKVYGSIKLQFKIENDDIYLENIEPSQLLLDLYAKLTPTYKGIPYRNEKDLFKIKVVKGV